MTLLPLRRKKASKAAASAKKTADTPRAGRPPDGTKFHGRNIYSLSTVQEISTEAVNDLEPASRNGTTKHGRQAARPKFASIIRSKSNPHGFGSVSKKRSKKDLHTSGTSSVTRDTIAAPSSLRTSTSSRKSSDSFHTPVVLIKPPTLSTPANPLYQNASLSTSRLSDYFHRDKKSSNPTLIPANEVESTSRFGSKRLGSMFKFKQRSGSVSSGSRNNSMFSFGNKKSFENLRSQSELAKRSDYEMLSVRSMRYSTSQRSLSKNSNDFSADDESYNMFNRRTPDENSWPKHSARSSLSSRSTDLLSDVPQLRVSSDATSPSTFSSSPARLVFEIPHLDHTDLTQDLSTIISQPEEPTSNKELSKPERKTSTLFSPFSHLFPDSKDLQHASQDPNSTPPSSFRHPLQRLRRKTASMFFSTDPLEDPDSENLTSLSDATPAAALTQASKSPSLPPPSPASQASLAFSPPPPLIRSHSSMNADTNSDSKDTQGIPKDVPTRRRSRTLSSIEPKSNFSNPFAVRSKSSIFTARKDSEFFLPPSTASPSPNHSSLVTPVPNEFDLVSLPEKAVGESPTDYLNKVQEVCQGPYIAGALAKYGDIFHKSVLKLHVETLFDFKGFPLDMALRTFLMFTRLPKETQQIDRVLEALAFRYHECNPDIYSSAENAYFVVFSLVILQTDFFNKNNKYKMQKSDYFRNTESSGVSKDILSVSLSAFFRFHVTIFFY